MSKFTVKLACITDMTMSVEVEADTPDQATEIALQESADSPDWEFPDNRPEPMEGTVEAYAVDDAEGDEVATYPQTTYSEYANALGNAEIVERVRHELVETREAISRADQRDAQTDDEEWSTIAGCLRDQERALLRALGEIQPADEAAQKDAAVAYV